MPMVDIVVSKGGKKWRNRGLNSVPFAHCWESVGRAATGAMVVSAYMEEKIEGSETDSMWGPLAENIPVTATLTGKRSKRGILVQYGKHRVQGGAFGGSSNEALSRSLEASRGVISKVDAGSGAKIVVKILENEI